MNDENEIVNERAESGSGVKHDKHAPASEADIEAAADAAEIAEAEAEAETEAEAEQAKPLTETEKRAIAVPTAEFSKEDLLEFAERNEIDVDSKWTQTELFDAITELLESES